MATSCPGEVLNNRASKGRIRKASKGRLSNCHKRPILGRGRDGGGEAGKTDSVILLNGQETVAG